MRGRDLSKQLDEKEVRRLRTLLDQNPQIAEQLDSEMVWPRMYFTEDYYPTQQAWKAQTDPLLKHREYEKMQRAVRVAWDEEEASELIEDGLRASPADFLPPDQDPRIPRGTEGRRAAVQKRLSVKEELHALRLRLQQLEAIDAALPVDEEKPARSPKGKLHVPPGRKRAPAADLHV